MTVRGVRSSWLASAANSRCPAQGAALTRLEGLADRDERQGRVQRTEPERDEPRRRARRRPASTISSAFSVVDLGRAVLERLEEVRLCQSWT